MTGTVICRILADIGFSFGVVDSVCRPGNEASCRATHECEGCSPEINRGVIRSALEVSPTNADKKHV